MSIEKDCACRGKNLDRFLQVAILNALYTESLHGFVLLQKIAESPMFHGEAPDPTGMYRYLKKMESSGLLTSSLQAYQSNSSRRVYEITEQGRLCFGQWLTSLEEYQQNLAQLIQTVDETLNKNSN